MRKLPTLFLLGTLFTGAAAENSLVNPGFELGNTGSAASIPGWTPFLSYAVDSTNALVYQSTNQVPVHGGTNTFKTWGGFQPYDTESGAYQNVPAAPDSTWAAEAWVLTHPDDRMAGENTCWVEVTFRSNTDPNNPLATYASAPVTADSPTGEWIRLVVTDDFGGTNLTAPAGTSVVRSRIVFRQVGGTYAGGSAYVDDVVLRKTSAPDPEITVHPITQALVYGQDLTMTVTATGRSALSFRWQKNGGDLMDGGRISGVTTSNLTVRAVEALDEGAYTVVVNNNAGTLTSDPAFLSVSDPGILVQPEAQTLVEGGTLGLSLQAAGSTALSYRWYLNGNMLSDGGRVSGATAATLTVSGLTLADAGEYNVLVSSAQGTVTSEAARVRVKTVAEMLNLLENGSFEEGTAFWTSFNGNVVESTNALVVNSESTYAPTHTGTNVNKSYGASVWNGVFQDRSVIPGQAFAAEVWLRTEAEDAIASPNTGWLELQFLTAGNDLVGLYRSDLVTAFSPTSTWVRAMATNVVRFWGDYTVVGTTNVLVAPEGAAKARFQVTLNAPGGGAGSLYADDARLVLVELLALEITVTGNQVQLSIPTQAGVSYEVQRKGSLQEPNWQPLTIIEGDGQRRVVTDTLGAGAFYRVEQK